MASQARCDCSRAEKGKPFRKGWCWDCWCRLNNRYVSSTSPAKPKPKPLVVVRPPCIHFGAVISYEDCACVAKHVHRCEVHGQCRLGDASPSVRSCTGCAEYEADN